MLRYELKKQAKDSLKGNYGIAIAVMVIGSLISGVLSATGVGGLLSGLISIGFAAVYTSIIRNKEAKLETLFCSFNYLGSAIVTSILYAVFIALWSLLFLIPGIVKSYSYAMTFYILNDNPNLSDTQAIKHSEEMMKGHKAELFKLHLSFIWWYLLIIVTFGLAAFYVVPYINATNAAYYEYLLSLKTENNNTNTENAVPAL